MSIVYSDKTLIVYGKTPVYTFVDDMVAAPTVGRFSRTVVVVRVTVYKPGSTYVWLGDDRVLVIPSPKDHNHVSTLPTGVERSLKVTVSGAGP